MLNRRDFLNQSAAVGAAGFGGVGMLGGASSAWGQRIPVANFHAARPMMVGLNAFSFSKMLNATAKGRKGPGMSIFELLDYCVDPQHRFDAVDITAYYFPNYSSSEATVPADSFVDEVRKRAADLGLPISGTGVGNSLTGVPFDREGKYGDGTVFSKDEGGDRALIDQDTKRIKAWIEVAARLGAPVIRVFAGLEPSYLMAEHIKPNDPEREAKAKKLAAWRAEAFKWMVDDLSEIAAYGKQFGVVVGIQNHGDFLKTADETLELIKAVDSQWLGVIVDTGYFQTADPYVDIEKVLPYGVNFQIKEYVRVCESPYMTPAFEATDLDRLMGIVKRAGYRGYLPIETLSAGKTAAYEPLKEVPLFLGEVRKSIERTG